MVGTKRYILLIISLTIFLTAESAVKYRTPELKRLAQIVGVDEKALIPGTNHIDNYTVMLDDRSFYTFMDEVYKEKLITGENVLYKDDLIAFIHKLQARDEKAAGWSDAGIKKMRDNFKSILRDGGLISATGNDRQILRPLLTDETEKFLEDQGLMPIRKILSGER